MQTKSYKHAASCYRFRILRADRGWRAQVILSGRYRNVVSPSTGKPVLEATKREMKKYLDYAYGATPRGGE